MSIKERVELPLSLATVVQDTSTEEELVVQAYSHVTTAQHSDDYHDSLLRTGHRLDITYLLFVTFQ